MNNTALIKNGVQIGILLTLTALVLGYFYLLPQLKITLAEHQSVTKQKNSLEAELMAIQTQTAELTRLQGAYSGKLAKVKAAVPITEEMPSLYIQLEDLTAAPNGITEAAYTVGEPEVAAVGGVTIPVSITATGSYENLKKYLITLETAVRPISFSSVSFAETESGVGSLAMTASGVVRAVSLSPAYTKPVSETANPTTNSEQ